MSLLSYCVGNRQSGVTGITCISELERIPAYPDAVIATAWQQLAGLALAHPRQLTVEHVHQAMLGYKLFGIFQKVAA